MSLHIESGEPPDFGVCLQSWELPSQLDRKAGLVEALVAELRGRGWVSAHEEHWLVLCLDEVVVNAMLHGNEGDPSLSIHVHLYDAESQWVILVCDQGEGFNADEVPDPDDDESLYLEHGRGILIMSQWLDELRFYRGGSCATMIRCKDGHSEDTED